MLFLPDGRRGLPAVLAGALLAAACGRDAPRAAAAESRVEPLVLARPQPPRDGSLVLAAIFPTVGRHALSGVQSLHGAELAIADLNRAGGIRGRRVALLEYPIGSYFLDARAAASLAADAGALGVVGSNSSDLSMAIAEEAEARGFVQVSNVSTAQDLTWNPVTGRDRPFVFRVCSSDVAMGTELAVFARDTLGARRAAVLYEVGRTYSTRLAKSFLDRFRESTSGHVVAEFLYLALETDFRSQLRDVKAFRPDVVFLPGSFPDATLIAREAEAVGLVATLLGADAWSSPLLFKRGGPSQRAYFVDHCWPPPGFDQRYQEAFGQPTQGCRAVLAYDAVRTLASGLEALGPIADAGLEADLAGTRQRLRDAVAAVDFKGLTGRIRFDRVGDRRTGMAVLAVDPGAATGWVSSFYGWVEER